ncbi:MAG: hypothetical protein COB02_01440 [Candidatus Cloacimonadota bacterium]|nr:MAG: hypothetical protein COB02_01440 [Candidatus Cloacimonadota bacterium]
MNFKLLFLFFFFFNISISNAKAISPIQRQVEILLSVNKVKDARTLVLKALKVNSLDPYAMGMNAYLLLVYMQRIKEAQKYTRKSLRIYPKHSLLLHTLAWSYYLQGQFSLSVQAFSKINPNIKQFELHYHWAIAASKAKRNNIAIQHFRIARQIRPTSHKLLMSMAVFYEKNNQKNQAVQLYQNALNLIGEKHPARKLLIQKIKEKKPLHQKYSFTQKYDSLWKDEPLKPQQNKKKYFSKKTINNKTITNKNPFLTKVIKQSFNPIIKFKNIETISQKQHYDLALKLMEKDLINDSILEFHTTININSQSSYAISANSYIQDLNILKNDNSTRINDLLNLSESLFKEAKYQISLYLLRKILLSEPKNARAQKNIAYLYLYFEKPMVSLAMLSNLLKKHPKYTEALIIKGYALSKLRRFTEAIQVFRIAQSTIKDDDYSKQYVKQLMQQVQNYEDPTQLHLQDY